MMVRTRLGTLGTLAGSTYSALNDAITQAIATHEGFTSGASRIAVQNNNPGNLRSWGSNPIVNGYAKFPTLMEGWLALHQQVNLNIGRGLTPTEFFCGGQGYAGYAPSADNNNCVAYAQAVASAIGADVNQRLDQFSLSGGDYSHPTQPGCGGDYAGEYTGDEACGDGSGTGTPGGAGDYGDEYNRPPPAPTPTDNGMIGKIALAAVAVIGVVVLTRN